MTLNMSSWKIQLRVKPGSSLKHSQPDWKPLSNHIKREKTTYFSRCKLLNTKTFGTSLRLLIYSSLSWPLLGGQTQTDLDIRRSNCHLKWWNISRWCGTCASMTGNCAGSPRPRCRCCCQWPVEVLRCVWL